MLFLKRKKGVTCIHNSVSNNTTLDTQLLKKFTFTVASLLLLSSVSQVQAAPACTNHALDWSQYTNLNNPGPYTETASDIGASGIDLVVDMPRASRDNKHVASSFTTFPVVATYMNGNPEVYRYWGQSDISPSDALTYNFSENITVDKFMFGGQRPPSGKFGYGVVTFWDGPNGTGSKVTSQHINGADSATTLTTMTAATTEAINVLPYTSSGLQANYPSAFLTTDNDYAMVTYDASHIVGQRTFTVLDMGGATVRSMTWKMYSSNVDVSPKGIDSKDLNVAEATGNILTSVNMSGYIGNFEFDNCPPPVSIGSVVWEDTNNDGFQNNNEPKIKDATVTLLMEDTINAGSYIAAVDMTDTTVTPITTSADGQYYFSNLIEGNYKVQVTPPSTYIPTANQTIADDNGAVENDSNIASSPSTGSYESAPIALKAGDEKQESDTQAGDNAEGVLGSVADKSGDMTVDFGFVLAPLTIPTVKIGNLVWIEDDNDGDATTGVITPVVGATVTAVCASTNYTAQTGSDGKYLIEVPINSNCLVSVATPIGTVPTYGSGDTTAGENNKTHNGSGTTVIVGTSDDLTLDFGFIPASVVSVPSPTVKIGNLVWIEDDNDGDATTGVITPVIGTTVTAVCAGKSYTTQTDSDGKYLIEVPVNSNCLVSVATPIKTIPTKGSDDATAGENNKTHDGTGTTVTVGTLDDLTLDFGFTTESLAEKPSTVKIGNRIWIEDDNDGDANTGNITKPEAGLVVTATAPDGKKYTGTTDTNGNYLIEVPANTTYIVTAEAPKGTCAAKHCANKGDKNIADTFSENNLTHDSIHGTTVIVGTQDNLTVDFGFCPVTVVSGTKGGSISYLLLSMLGLFGLRRRLAIKK